VLGTSFGKSRIIRDSGKRAFHRLGEIGAAGGWDSLRRISAIMTKDEGPGFSKRLLHSFMSVIGIFTGLELSL